MKHEIFADSYFTETLKAHGVTGQGYAQCTNAICKPIIGATVKEVKEARGIPANVNLRDTLSRSELAAIDFAEVLAEERIAQNNSQGNRECVKESSLASNAVAKALEHYRS